MPPEGRRFFLAFQNAIATKSLFRPMIPGDFLAHCLITIRCYQLSCDCSSIRKRKMINEGANDTSFLSSFQRYQNEKHLITDWFRNWRISRPIPKDNSQPASDQKIDWCELFRARKNLYDSLLSTYSFPSFDWYHSKCCGICFSSRNRSFSEANLNEKSGFASGQKFGRHELFRARKNFYDSLLST